MTHGIQLLQDIMLRGEVTAWWSVAALAGLSLVFLLLTVVLLRRAMRNA